MTKKRTGYEDCQCCYDRWGTHWVEMAPKSWFWLCPECQEWDRTEDVLKEAYPKLFKSREMRDDNQPD